MCSTALNAIRFVETPNGPFVNPSRASPVRIDCKRGQGSKNFHLFRQGKPLVAVVTACLFYSQLTHTGTYKMKQKLVRGSLHGQEMERYVGWNGMVMGMESYHGPLAGDQLQFSTRMESEEDEAMDALFTKKTRRQPPSSAARSGTSIMAPDTMTLSHLAESAFWFSLLRNCVNVYLSPCFRCQGGSHFRLCHRSAKHSVYLASFCW